MEKYRLLQEQKVDSHDELTSASAMQHPPGVVVDGSSHRRKPSSTTTTTTTTLPDSGTASSSTSSSEYPEVRITQQGKPRNYISYAMNLLMDGSSSSSSSSTSSSSKTIVLKAMGRAINKAVTIAEILKRKMPLHQWNVLSSLEMIDLYEPIEEGLEIVENRRYVSCLTITLSLTLLLNQQQQQQQPTKHGDADDDVETNMMTMPLDIYHFGYQPPLPITDLQQQHHQQSNVTTNPHGYNKPRQQQQQQHRV